MDSSTLYCCYCRQYVSSPHHCDKVTARRTGTFQNVSFPKESNYIDHSADKRFYRRLDHGVRHLPKRTFQE
jgi:hypothetical protein